MFDYDCKPDYLMADYVESITNGFIEAFGTNFKRGMFWTHASIKMDENCTRLESIKSLIRGDINKLQMAQSEEIFDVAYGLFKKKWESHNDKSIKTYLAYFEKTWIKVQKGWFEGFAPGLPSMLLKLQIVYLNQK